MKHIIPLFLLSFIGCQSAHIIDPKSLPRQVASRQEIQLLSSDGTQISLTNLYQNHTATVLLFWQIGCPCVKRYQERINKLAAQFSPENVAFIYISSNNNETFDNVKIEYQKRGLTLPLMRDEGGILAQAIGAKGTPTAAVINQKGEMIFLGWIDNERYEHESGRVAYLENALNEYLNSHAVTLNTSPMFGCSIQN